MEFDHELRLWLKSKKSRKTHLDTRVEAVQSDREIARGMEYRTVSWDNFDRI